MSEYDEEPSGYPPPARDRLIIAIIVIIVVAGAIALALFVRVG